MADNADNPEAPKQEKVEFKKPVLVGRVGKPPKKVKTESDNAIESSSHQRESENTTGFNHKSSLPPAVLLKELSTPIPYKEPKWSGTCPEGKFSWLFIETLCSVQ